MDMTSGFHQMAVDISVQDYLAFMTEDGLLTWTRAPMGPKNVPPYFQQVMSTEVFPDFLLIILAIYMDDILAWAKDFREMLQRLRLILERARTFHILFNPNKSKFGLKQVEYVGHLLSEDGLNFSSEKKEYFVTLKQCQTKG